MDKGTAGRLSVFFNEGCETMARICSCQLPNTYTVILVLRGAGRFDIPPEGYNPDGTQVLIITNALNAVPVTCTEDYKFCGFQFDAAFLENLFDKRQLVYFDRKFVGSQKAFSLPKPEVNTLKKIISLLFKTTESSPLNNLQRVRLLFNLVFYQLYDIIIGSNPPLSFLLTRKEIIVCKFYDLLQENAINEHSVKFYADQLHISSGHLAKILKEVRQVTPKYVIEKEILERAKILLRDQSFTIYQIAELLNFSNSSAFSIFFKNQTSISPLDYRQNTHDKLYNPNLI